MPSQQSLFAAIATEGQASGVLMVKLIGPSIGQREVPIITDLVAPAIADLASKLRYLVLDMSQITFMNSIGLGMCIDLRNRAHKAGGKTVLLGMNAELIGLIKMVKVDRLYAIANNRAELDKIMRK